MLGNDLKLNMTTKNDSYVSNNISLLREEELTLKKRTGSVLALCAE